MTSLNMSVEFCLHLNSSVLFHKCTTSHTDKTIVLICSIIKVLLLMNLIQIEWLLKIIRILSLRKAYTYILKIKHGFLGTEETAKDVYSI